MLRERLLDQTLHFSGEGDGTQEDCYLPRVTSHFYSSVREVQISYFYESTEKKN